MSTSDPSAWAALCVTASVCSRFSSGSRNGGQAVAIANAFNDLSHDPDDATLVFNHHFKLGAIAAIAPVDGQYEPRDRPVPMRDTNYFTLQGSMDGDMTSFMGSSQYSRAGFSGNIKAFKASLYLSGANQGQFNTLWGRYTPTSHSNSCSMRDE